MVSGGSAADTVVQGGTQTIFADASAADRPGYRSFSGGTQTIFADASATDTTISSGGLAAVSGDLAGVQVFSGGVLSAEGFDFNAGHSVTGAIVHSGGFLSDAGVVVGAQILQGATLFAAEGGSAANTVVEQGGVMLLDGGAATDTTVLAGGELFAPSFYFTFLSGVTVSSGGVFILSAAIVQDVTVESGGTLYLLNGPGTSGITVNPGVTIVRPEAFIISAAAPSYRDTALVSAANLLSGQIIATGGQETVSSGGVAIDTTVSASIFSYQSPAQYVEAGGSSLATFVLSGGEQLISGTSTESAVAVKTVVGDGGYVTIDSGGFALSATLEAGGQMHIEGGFAKNLLFQPGGALVLGALQGSGTTGTATLNSSDVLTVSVDGQHYSIQLVGDYAGDTFTVRPNPYQGAFVFLSATAATDLVPAAARPLDTPHQAMAGMAAGQNLQLMLIDCAAHQPAGPGEANPLEFPDR